MNKFSSRAVTIAHGLRRMSSFNLEFFIEEFQVEDGRCIPSIIARAEQYEARISHIAIKDSLLQGRRLFLNKYFEPHTAILYGPTGVVQDEEIPSSIEEVPQISTFAEPKAEIWGPSLDFKEEPEFCELRFDRLNGTVTFKSNVTETEIEIEGRRRDLRDLPRGKVSVSNTLLKKITEFLLHPVIEIGANARLKIGIQEGKDLLLKQEIEDIDVYIRLFNQN